MKVSPCLKNGKSRWRVVWCVRKKARRKFFKTEKAARDYARDSQQEQKEFGREWATLPPVDRAELVQCWRQAKERGYSISEACRFWETNGSKTATGIIVEELCEKFLAAKKSEGLRTESLRLLGVTLGQFASGRQKRKAATITTDEINTWLDSQTWGPWRRRGVIIDIGNLFNWAVGAGLLLRNPVDGVRRPRIDDKTPVILTPEAAGKLLKLCRVKYRRILPWLVISLFAGLRAAEVQRLRWETVLDDTIVLASHQTKGRARRLVTIRPTLKAWLDTCRKKSGLVYPGPRTPISPEPRLRKEFGGLAKNVLRHSFISYALGSGESVSKVAAESGNSEAIIFKHYREIVRPDQAAAFWSLLPP